MLARREQRIFVEDGGIRVDGDGRDVQFASRGAAVQRLDVLEYVFEAPAPVSIFPSASA
jgi:hypothetical protein